MIKSTKLSAIYCYDAVSKETHIWLADDMASKAASDPASYVRTTLTEEASDSNTDTQEIMPCLIV